MTSFTGSNSERQSVGHPGHCDACAERGHVAAHPNLGCSDVGCSSVHPEPAEPIVPTPVAPMVALISRGDIPPQILTSLGWRSWEQQVPVHVFHLLHETEREAPPRGRVMLARDVAPTGWLYTATGARDLDPVLTAMWTCPEADAMRDLPPGQTYGKVGDPYLTVMEQAQTAMDNLWSEFLAQVTS